MSPIFASFLWDGRPRILRVCIHLCKRAKIRERRAGRRASAAASQQPHVGNRGRPRLRGGVVVGACAVAMSGAKCVGTKSAREPRERSHQPGPNLQAWHSENDDVTFPIYGGRRLGQHAAHPHGCLVVDMLYYHQTRFWLVRINWRHRSLQQFC